MDDSRAAAERWIEGYLRAWRSNEPDDIRALFTPDAEYRVNPWTEPLAGREAIVAGWLDRRDEPGSFTFRYEVVATDGELAFVEGETVYTRGVTYSNLWVIRLAREGRASSFTEWWMDQSDPA